MRRILIGYGTSLGNHLTETGAFSECLTYKKALGGLQKCEELVIVAPPANRLSGGKLGKAGAALLTAVDGVAKRIVVLSSIDVYPVKSLSFDEDSIEASFSEDTVWAREGANLAAFEQGILRAAARSIVLRLPEVFGPGFTKGLPRCLLDETGAQINRVAIHQWYPVTRLERDMVIARYLRAPAVNLCTEPVSMEAILHELFPGEPGQVATPAPYSRISTRYAEAFGGCGGYIMNAKSVVDEIRRYVTIHRRLRATRPPLQQQHRPEALVRTAF